MRIVTDTLGSICVCEPQTYRNLHLFPLFAQRTVSGGYVALDDAIASEQVRLTEAEPAGHVPVIRLVSDASLPVFLLDGQELLGAMQDRVLNVSVLAPPRSEITLAVSCVEAARWDPETDEFAAAPRVHFAGGRALRTAQVTESLRTQGTVTSDQVEVWAEIEDRSARLAVRSPTRAHAALFERHGSRIELYTAGFEHLPQQVGALFAIGSDIVGFDLFDDPATCAGHLRKLVRSAAIDALLSEDGHAPTLQCVRQFLSRVARARTLRFAATGMGEDVRLCAPGLAGGALVALGRVIHLAAFVVDEQS